MGVKGKTTRRSVSQRKYLKRGPRYFLSASRKGCPNTKKKRKHKESALVRELEPEKEDKHITTEISRVFLIQKVLFTPH